MRTSKNTRLGILATAGVGVAGLAIAGFALPATADDTSTTVEQSESTTDLDTSFDDFQAWVGELVSLTGDVAPVTGVSPETGIGDVTVVEGPLVGDIGSGNQAPIGSGNDIGSGDVSAPIGSGNDTTAPIGSGNDTTAPIGSGNETGNGNEVGNGNGSGNEAGNGNNASTGDLGTDISNDVNDVVDNVTGDLDSTVDDVTGSLGLGGLLD